MSNTANTIIIAATASIVAATVTFMATHPPKGSQAHASAPVAPAVEVSNSQPEHVDRAPEPKEVTTPPPLHETRWEDQASSQGIYLSSDFAGNREDIMELAVYGRPRAKQAVLNLLNDPDSAQFRHVVFSRFENGAAVFCGAVNARNSFGGYAPFRAFYAVGDWATIEEDTDSWGIGFRRQCGDDKVIGAVENF